MADLGGFHVNQHQIRVRKKSERIMKKTYFSNFKNTIDNPVDVDEDSEVGRTNDVHSNEGCSSKGKCLEIQQSTEADVARSTVVPRPPQGSSKGKVFEILKPQEPTEAEVERTNVVPRPEQGSIKGKEAKVERTTGVPSIAQGSSKGKVLEILGTQETTDLKVTKPIVQQTSKQAARVGKVPEIQLQQDSDPVMLLDVNVQTEVKASNDVMGAPRKSKNEKVKEDIVEHTDVQGYPLGIRTRTSPKALWETVKSLNSNQRASIKEMGFDALLDMTLDGIPSKLGHYVVDMLDTSKMTIQLRDGQIPITVKSIHDVLGLPTGGLDLNLVAPSKGNDAVVSAWRKQFSKDRMRPKDVMNVIQQSEDAGVMFKMSFLVIMLNTLAECSRVGVCNLGFLKRIDSLDMIPRIDWCKYVYDCIGTSKMCWKRDSFLSFYAGPLTCLTMLYVQATTCDGIQNQLQAYPLRTWTLELLRRKQDLELSRGGFGYAKLKCSKPIERGSYDQSIIDHHTAEDIPESSKAKEAGNQNVTKEECVIMMGERIEDLFSARREADTMLQAYIERFPGERCFDQFKKELARMFKGSMWECRNDEGHPREKELPHVHVTPPKMTTTSDPAMLSPLSQFWTSPTVIAEVDRASNERASITTKGVGCNTDPKQFERVKMTSLEAPLESVGRVRSRGFDDCDPRTSKLRRRAQTEIEAPAFDLGISPSKDAVITCIDSSKATGGQKNVRSEIPKRDPKLSFKLRSPYVTRAVTFEVSSDERKLQDWILRGVGGILEPVFMTTKGKAITRQTMQSLVSQCVVGSEIIDVWSMVLNRDERMRSNESLRRYFVPTDISMDAIVRDEDLNSNQRYDRFRKKITCCMNNDKELISMRNVDLVFFPIVEPSFNYVVVFDLKHPSIAIIDSQTREGKVDDIYGSSTVGLQDMMIMHLLKEGHGAWKVYAEMDQDKIKTRWQLRENTVDAGVMLMRHMETFFGGDVLKWDCGLYKESTKQKRQLKDLRTKYCSKMLLNDVNIRKTSIVCDVERFIAMETSYNARKNGGARQMSRVRK